MEDFIQESGVLGGTKEGGGTPQPSWWWCSVFIFINSAYMAVKLLGMILL
jgi:hypothetical protein